MLYTEHALYHWRCVYFFVAKSSRWWVELDRQKSRNWLISSITTLASYFFLNKSLVIRKWNPLFLYWNLHTGNIYIYSYTCTCRYLSEIINLIIVHCKFPINEIAIYEHQPSNLRYSTCIMYWYKKNVVPQKDMYICMSTKTHVHIHVQEHLLIDVGFCFSEF